MMNFIISKINSIANKYIKKKKNKDVEPHITISFYITKSNIYTDFSTYKLDSLLSHNLAFFIKTLMMGGLTIELLRVIEKYILDNPEEGKIINIDLLTLYDEISRKDGNKKLDTEDHPIIKPSQVTKKLQGYPDKNGS